MSEFNQIGELKSVRITWGGESIQPIDYNNYQVGSIEILVDDIPKGTNLEDVYDNWKPRLESLCDQQAAEKFRQWKEHQRYAKRNR